MRTPLRGCLVLLVGGCSDFPSENVATDAVIDGATVVDAAGLEDGGTTADADIAPDATSPDAWAGPSERLFLGTGEYLPTARWNAVLRFEGAQTLDSRVAHDIYTPDGVVDIREDVASRHDYEWNFAHSIYFWEGRDEMFLATIFSTHSADLDDYYLTYYGVTDPTDEEINLDHGHPCTDPEVDSVDCGAVVVVPSASAMNGAQTPVRALAGPSTGLVQPHGLWVDEARDSLYVANSFAGNVLVWDDASGADGDTPPDRIITGAYMAHARPIHVFVDSGADRLFVALAPEGDFSLAPAILVYEAASTLNADPDGDGVALSDDYVEPRLRIIGEGSGPDPECVLDVTRLSCGNNFTTHNVLFVPDKELLIVAHHTNEVLFFDMKGTDWMAAGEGTTTDLHLPARMLQVNEDPDGADTASWSTYGIFYVAGDDRLYASTGYTPTGPYATEDPTDYEQHKHAVRVYDGVSSESLEGWVEPDRVIYWSNVDTYFPPQPLWVTVH